LQKLKQKLNNVKDALIIIDEIDVGDKEDQKLHKVLKESGVLTIEYIENNNIRLVVVSATIINELRELFKWGDKHEVYYMTIPDSYIGHKEFLELEIIQEFYPINTIESANKWITEDILEKYGSDYRVHIIRTDKKNHNFILDACIMNSINFKNHTSDDRISTEELSEIFDNITNHIVIAVKGFYRRANLIPNVWKMKIGAMHELYVKKLDTNVQVQGLPGRMTGYWKETIMNGHKTGPYRTSIKAMKEDEHFYENPFSEKHHSSKKSKSSMLHPDNIPGLNYSKPVTETFKRIPVIINIDENCLLFKEKKRDNRIKYIEKLLKKEEKYTKILNFILNKDVFCVQITHPKSDNSYKKHITDVINAYNNNTPYSVDLKNENKSKNNWQVFIDDKENRLCFVVWCIDKNLYSDSEEKLIDI
jgi:hypothetical protein